MIIAVEAALPRFRADARRVRRAIATALSRLTKRQVHVGVFLVSDAEMKALHRRTRGKDRPTNVLSFSEFGHLPHPELPKKVRAMGEIFLAPDFIARKGEDLAMLAIHGLLHLFGYTHGRTRDRIEMERKEDELHYGLHGNRIGRRLEHGARRGRRRTA